MIGLTKAVGKEFAGADVSVNAISPAVIETPMLGGLQQHNVDYMVEDPDGPDGPGRRGRRVDLLACDAECSFSTGAIFDISGGRAVF